MAARFRPISRSVAQLATRNVSRQARLQTRVITRFNSSTSGGQQQQQQQQQEKQAPPPPPPKSGGNGGILALVAAAAIGGGYYYYQTQTVTGKSTLTAESATYDDYKKVYQAIAEKLEDETDHDDGSFAPVLVRLAWHSSGTYDKNAGDGGSGPGTMRFQKESGYDANNGMYVAKSFLQSIHDQFPWISYGDLYTLGGVAGIQEMQGPIVKWRAGRQDKPVEHTTPDGRLPDGTQGSKHIRDVFYRMGFNDQEIVALIGAHGIGRTHTAHSGFSDRPWTFSPTTFTNTFFTLLLDEKWQYKKWDGPKEFEDTSTQSLIMLPTDYALIQDKAFKPYVLKYAKDEDAFFKDFAVAFQKLLELGVPFAENTPEWTFEPRNGA